MSAGRGDFQRTLDRFLAFHVGEIEFVLARALEDARDIHLRRRDLHFAFEKADALSEILDGDYLQPVHHGRFGRVVFGHQDADFAVGFRA